MSTCPSCDFCTYSDDGTLICAIRDEQVHGGDHCECWQSDSRKVDGDYWYERMTWPAKSKKRK